LHVFTYSERPNTEAIDMDGVIDIKERQRRSKMLRILSDKKRRQFYEENLTEEAEVLFENDIEDGKMHGFTSNYIRVFAKYDPLIVNEIKRVKLISIDENGLVQIEETDKAILEAH